MLLQVAWCCAFDVILGAVEWFITSVDSFMLLQVASCCAFVVTLGAVEWFITSVDSFMPAQAQPDFLSPWTRLFDIWSVSLAVANILLPVWRNLVCGNFIQIKFTNTQVFGKQKKLLIFGLNTWGDSNQLWRGSWQQLSFLVKRRKYKQIVIRKIFISDKPDQPV